MKNYLLVLSLMFCHFANAQNWETLNLEEDQPGLELNPLKGFVPLYGTQNEFPHSIEGKLFGLNEVMTGMNTFNWAVIDTYISEQAAKGNFSYLQVNIDPSKDGVSYLPNFLVPLVDIETYDAGNGVAGDCPDYNDPDLMTAMQNFIAAFGTKYNNDDRVFLVHLGLYGQWGEWHIIDIKDARPEFEMTEENKAIIANVYKNAFPNKHLLARYTENIPDPQVFGYSDGLFFGQSIGPNLPFYFHNILKAYDADQNWKIHPIGGEIDPLLQAALLDVLPNNVGQDVFDCLDAIHPTWLFDHHVFNSGELVDGNTEWNNSITVQKAMGYNFHIDQYRLTASDGKPTIEVNLQNKGIAPMYANWDLEFKVLDSNGQAQSLGTKKWNLNLIQPDVTDNYRSFFSETALADGTYTFLLRVVNPMEAHSNDAEPVRFANNTQDANEEGWLTLGDVTISSGTVGVLPIRVTGLSVTSSSSTKSVGETLQLSANVFPGNAANSDVTWVSDHPGTASVDANGFVSAGPQYGTVTIFAYTHDSTFVGTSFITVEPTMVPIPATIEAEDFIRMSGMIIQDCCSGGNNLGYIETNDWIDYGVTVDGDSDFVIDFMASSPSGGELSLINENGDILALIDIDATLGYWDYDVSTSNTISLPDGSYRLRFLASNGGFNLDWIEFKFDNPLPIELVNLKASPKDQDIALEWMTRFENNNEYFSIEHSLDGISFQEIGKQGGSGTTNSFQNYSYLHENVAEGWHYYRLKQVDFNGKYQYTDIVNAEIQKNVHDVDLMPNPASDIISIQTKTSFKTDAKLQLVNMRGQVILSDSLPSGVEKKDLDISELPAGIYYLRLLIGGEIVIKKIIKQ